MQSVTPAPTGSLAHVAMGTTTHPQAPRFPADQRNRAPTRLPDSCLPLMPILASSAAFTTTAVRLVVRCARTIEQDLAATRDIVSNDTWQAGVSVDRRCVFTDAFSITTTLSSRRSRAYKEQN